MIFEPLDFMDKLAALVPKPRVNLTRFHGVFAPNSKRWVHVTPAGVTRSMTWKRPTPIGLISALKNGTEP